MNEMSSGGTGRTMTRSPLEQVVDSFTFTALLGAALIVTGIVLGVVVNSPFVIAAAGGSGAIFFYAGLLGRIRGKRMMQNEMRTVRPEERYPASQLWR
jgi:hypothetical protein